VRQFRTFWNVTGTVRFWAADDVLDWLDERSCPHCRKLRRARERLRR